MGQTPYLNNPLAYMLLPSKSQEVYESAFTLFKIEAKTQFQNTATFITDFFQFCYFHFTQILKRYFDIQNLNI